MTSPPSGDPAALRRAAEARVKERAAARPPQNEAGLRRLQHELEVHQFELEMQNEQLSAAPAKLSASLERYAGIYDFAPAGYFNLDSDGTIELVNFAGAELLDLERGRLAGRRFGLFVAEADRPAFAALLTRAFASEEQQIAELRLERTGRVVHLKATRSPDGQSCFLVLLDVTERKAAQLELEKSRAQLRALLARVNRTQAEERIRLSRQVHDELGQVLTALKMDLRWLERKLSEPGLRSELNPLLDRTVAAAELADSAIAAVQKVALGLRSGPLDTLGLVAALRQEAREFTRHAEIHCTVEAPEPGPTLPAELADELFQVCREALANVARHARAAHVISQLRSEPGAVVLEVRDNGVGFADEALNSPRALGVLGMRERAAGAGGTISFTHAEPQGMTVTVRLPLQDAGDEVAGSASRATGHRL